jgi:dienelactone hydrolase
MKRTLFTLLGFSLLVGCGRQSEPSTDKSRPSDRGGGGEGGPQIRDKKPPEEGGKPKAKVSLADARRGFKTKLVRKESENKPAPAPPPQLFRLVRYESPAGKMAAYLSVKPKDGKKHPAIIWIVGGFSNSIGSTPWTERSAENDQSASAFRKAGIVMMYPSFRGGNDNPGFKEGFYGEVDDVLAAADFLAKQDFVDPDRIYLGGHSTGGTLALLAAECSDRFRAVFSFGPAADVVQYGKDTVPFDPTDKMERALRAPVLWLHPNSIRKPVFVFEGTGGNLQSLQVMAQVSMSPLVHFHEVEGADHFNILAPVTRVIAAKIVKDDGPRCNITFSKQDLKGPFAR